MGVFRSWPARKPFESQSEHVHGKILQFGSKSITTFKFEIVALDELLRPTLPQGQGVRRKQGKNQRISKTG